MLSLEEKVQATDWRWLEQIYLPKQNSESLILD